MIPYFASCPWHRIRVNLREGSACPGLPDSPELGSQALWAPYSCRPREKVRQRTAPRQGHFHSWEMPRWTAEVAVSGEHEKRRIQIHLQFPYTQETPTPTWSSWVWDMIQWCLVTSAGDLCQQSWDAVDTHEGHGLGCSNDPKLKSWSGKSRLNGKWLKEKMQKEVSKLDASFVVLKTQDPRQIMQCLSPNLSINEKERKQWIVLASERNCKDQMRSFMQTLDTYVLTW